MTNLNNIHEKVLILGNGFDLNLGLKTKYTYYIQSVEFQNLFRPHSLFNYLMQQNNLNNWIDIEIELKKYSVEFDDPNYERDYQMLCDSLINYISKIDYSQINKSSFAYKLIKELKNKNFLIFDFNYTNSLMHIGQELGFDIQDLESRIIKIHGSSREKKIIFGVEDKANIKSQHVFLKKSYPPYYKAISLNMQLKKADHIYIFGHSLGETDHTYFKEFFSTASNEGIVENKRTFYLYFYDQTAYRDLHIQIDRLTDQRLMGFKHKCLFEPIEVK